MGLGGSGAVTGSMGIDCTGAARIGAGVGGSGASAPEGAVMGANGSEYPYVLVCCLGMGMGGNGMGSATTPEAFVCGMLRGI